MEKIKTIKELNAEDLVIQRIQDALVTLPAGKDKKAHIAETLGKVYGKTLAEKIISNLPKNFWKEENTKNPKISERLKGFLFGAATTGILAGALIANQDKDSKNLEDLKTNTKIPTKNEAPIIKPKEEKPAAKFETPKTAPPPENPRFRESIYEALPLQGKEVYKSLAENDPTPGHGYMILDKMNAKQYIFDQDNRLMAIIVPGFGKEQGDEQNTAEKYNEGRMTTPSGVYLLSNATVKEDIEEYGKLQFSLYGTSVLGNDEFIKEHQTYAGHGELKPRTEKLNSPTPTDNNFSNGCINISAEDFEKYVKPNFKGDYSELLFVLQDEKGLKSGVKFDVDNLLHKIANKIIIMANNEENIYKNSPIKDQYAEKLKEVELRREAANRILTSRK